MREFRIEQVTAPTDARAFENFVEKAGVFEDVEPGSVCYAVTVWRSSCGQSGSNRTREGENKLDEMSGI